LAGENKSLEVAPGVEMEITAFSPDENKKYDQDYPRLTAVYTKNSVSAEKKHIISDWYDESVEVMRLIGQACKNDIQPSAGVFQGMRAQTGFGFGLIRPDYICSNVQGRTFDMTFPTTQAAKTWYGLYHNAAIGAAYNATALYLRKELGIGWLGLVDYAHDTMAEEVQLEINGKPLPVWTMLHQMGRAMRPPLAVAYGTNANATDTWNQPVLPDLRVFRFPAVEYLKPAIQYRSQYKASEGALANVWGRLCPAAVGIAYVTSDYLRNTAPTQPTYIAP
jgi:hypothetical protein